MTGQRPGETEAHKAVHDRYGIWPCVLHDQCPIASDIAAAYPIIAAAVAEQIAQRISGLAPRNCELNYDGTEDKEAAAWVQGLHNAYDVASEYGKEADRG